MKKSNRVLKIGKVQAIICSLLLVLGLTIPSYSWVNESGFKSDFYALDGITANNNLAFATDRYVLTAPYAPSKPITEDTKLSDLDNNKLFIFDGKRTDKEPYVVDLKSCYYPTRLVYDAEAKMTFIRGTQIDEDPETGDYLTSEVIKYFPLSEDGKITSLEAQTIPIKTDDGRPAVIAPNAFVHCGNNILMITNGSSIFAFNTQEGFLYQVRFITPENYDPENNTITSLDFDSQSRVLTIIINKKTKIDDNQWKHESELYLYEVKNDGRVDQLSHIAPVEFGNGAITAGSNVFIDKGIDPENKNNNVGDGYFTSSDGRLCRISWNGPTANLGKITEVASFAEFVQPNGEYLSSVKTYYDKANKAFKMLKNGSTSYIHRPINVGSGRIGKIHRPINVRVEVESPALGLIQFGKRNKVAAQKVFTSELAGEGGVSDLITDDSETTYFTTYSGKLFELSGPSEVTTTSLRLVGQVGDRLSSVTYFAPRNAMIAVSALEAGDEGIASPGGIYFIKRKGADDLVGFVNWAENAFSNNAVLGLSYGSIRRPCNNRPQ